MKSSRSVFICAGLAGLVLCGSAAAETVYSSISSPLPGSYPSLGYEATSTDEFGDHVVLAPGPRDLATVTVVLTDWACGNDYTYDSGTGVWTPDRAGDEACVTTPGATWDHPITANIYAVDNSGPDPAVGALLATRTQVFAIPFRPSWDSANCPAPANDIPFGGTWFDPVLGTCVHGYNTPITFDFSSSALTLPDEVIVSVAYNTADYGAAPIHSPGPFNSLNYGLLTAPPSVGTDPEPGTTFFDTSFAGFYCDGGAGGVGTFRRDAGCWDVYIPAMQVDTVECNPCEYAALLNPFLPRNQRLSATDPCYGTPAPAQPSDACCDALVMTLPFLPKAPTLSSTHACFVAP